MYLLFSSVQKNGENEKVGDVFTRNGNSWFYTNGKDLHYSLKEDSDVKRDMKDKDTVKKQSCLNLGNSEKIRLICEVEVNKLIDHRGSSKLPTNLD